MSKWKPGQLVTLNNRVYRIRKVEAPLSHRRCMMCQLHNLKQPCVEAADYPTDKVTFSIIKCMAKMPQGCIPKRISVSKNEFFHWL